MVSVASQAQGSSEVGGGAGGDPSQQQQQQTKSKSIPYITLVSLARPSQKGRKDLVIAAVVPCARIWARYVFNQLSCFCGSRFASACPYMLVWLPYV